MIKKWKKFIESISGTTDTISFGPNGGDQVLPTSLSTDDTEVIMGMDDNFYTNDEFDELYQEVGNLKISREFNKTNLDILIQTLNETK